MLKVEYPCREISSSYQNLNNPIITAAQSKKHLHDIRRQRQNQLTTNINECHRLHAIHKQIYNHQLNSSSSIEKSPNNRPINNEYLLPTTKYSIPRLDYASIIYRQAIPTFELESQLTSENDVSIINELTQHLSTLPDVISNDQIKSNRSLSPIKHDRQRSLSVSSIPSIDKRANKVYEKWPDHNQISEIIGYRINPPSSKLITSNDISSRPSRKTNRQKQTITTTKTPTSSKPKKSLSQTQKKVSKTAISPIIIDKPLSPPVPIPNPIKELPLKLPNLLCPSSITYSHRIQTRQWLMKHNFSFNTIRTLPLL